MATEFTSWEFTPLRALGTTMVGLRRQGAVPLTVVDPDTNENRPAAPSFELYGPADVAALCREAITRRFPAPGTRDAEETKLALIEVRVADTADLPWRYSPDMPARVKPWFVLVVGPATQISLLSGGARASISAAVLKEHDLGACWQWAHVHKAHGVAIARILSPYRLTNNTDYRACVVPAFTAAAGALGGAWDGHSDAVLRCFDSWTFRTGDQGDFPSLAEKLHVADLDALARRAGKPLGQAQIRYPRRGPGDPEFGDLATYGALKLPTAAPPPAAPTWVRDEVTALSRRIVSPDGRVVVTAPRYPAPFTDAAPVAGWSAELTADPRHRGAAGLGLWNAIEWQDRISAAAAQRVGDLEIAKDRVAQLAFGLVAAGSMWRRHVPADPAAALAVLAPVLGRLPTTTATTVLDEIAGRTTGFPRALLSSAARRILRPGPARTALAAPGANDPAEVLRSAARCPEAPPPPKVDPHRLRDAINRLPQDLQRQLYRTESPQQGLGLDAILGIHETATAWRPPCRPVDVDKLGGIVSGAVDPTGSPIVITQVLGTLDGVDGIGPVEIEPELDLPLWSFLSERSPDWMLPGAGDLGMHEVVALATNPPFVHALLAGANHQTLAELRWRNIPIKTGWSPLRKFWQRKANVRDIRPIRGWSAAGPLGAAAHSESVPNDEAVVLFRTTLFRRYPATVVYLYKNDSGTWTVPPDNTPLVANRRQYPTFTGSIGDDIVFFGFAIAPMEVANYWVVLEEPPAGYRFYHPKKVFPDPLVGYGNDSAATFASKTFALPARVLIAPLLAAP